VRQRETDEDVFGRCDSGDSATSISRRISDEKENAPVGTDFGWFELYSADAGSLCRRREKGHDVEGWYVKGRDEKDTMAKDSMSKGSMKKDSMSKDGMSKDEMKK